MNTLKDLNSDIVRYAIPHSCKQCVWCYDCSSKHYHQNNPMCRKFIPSNMDVFLNDTIKYFDENILKSSQKHLRRICSCNGATDDKVTTLDEYYVALINDSIKEIRKGKTVYIFNIHQLYDIVKFCNNISAKYQGDGIISLTGIKSQTL